MRLHCEGPLKKQEVPKPEVSGAWPLRTFHQDFSVFFLLLPFPVKSDELLTLRLMMM